MDALSLDVANAFGTVRLDKALAALRKHLLAGSRSSTSRELCWCTRLSVAWGTARLDCCEVTR
jgi:hypothetical protein